MPDLPASTAQPLDAASAYLGGALDLLRSGVLAPAARPDRTARRVAALLRWGLTPTAGYIASAARCPDRPAVIDDFGAVNFAELDRRSTRLAHALLSRDTQPGRPVAMLCGNHRGLVTSMLAAGKLGAHALLLNTSMSPAQLAAVVQAHRPAVLIADADLAGLRARLPVGLPVVAAAPGDPGPNLDGLIAEAPGAPISPPPRPGRMVVLTSGTTGPPKAALRPEPRGLGALGGLAAILSKLPLRAEQVILVAPPLFHTWGLSAFQFASVLSSTLLLQRRFEPEQTLRALAQHRASALVAVPVLLRRLLNLPERARAAYDTSALRLVASSGSALPGPLAVGFMDAFGDVLYNLYGSTEVSWASIATPADLRAAPGTAGRPPRGTRLAILDEAGQPLPPNEVGRIFVGHSMLFEGYAQGAAGGAPAGRETRHGLMSTGDVGRIDADGRLWVTGREDDMIVSGGENVYPSQVEEALAGSPEIVEAAVVEVPDEDFGQRLAAYVVLAAGASMTAEDVRARVRERLARYCVPRDVVFLDALPRNATGKVVKGDLPAR